MASDGKVIIDTQLDTKGLDKGLGSLGTTLAPALKKLGGLVAGYFSAKALLNFGKEAVNLASDIQEVQNVVDTAFGEMSYKMEQFADTAIEMYGISKLSAKQTGSTFMAMASGMGLNKESASDMAIALTGLSADMASFYNVSQDVASTSLKSIFTGETETLKKFGVVMTETNLQEFAYSQGIKTKVKNMTQAEKVQLRYNYVMAQTSLAQGDFAKTSDSWANQTRILSEQWKEFMSVIGSGLVQVLTPAIGVLNRFVSVLISAAKALASFLGIDMQVGGATGVSAEATEALASGMEDTADATDKAGKAAKKASGSIDELNTLSDSSGSGAGAGGGAGTIIPPLDTTQMDESELDVTNKLSELLDGLKEKFEQLGYIFQPLINALKNLWNTFKSIVGDIMGMWDLFMSVLESGSTKAAFLTILESAVHTLATAFDLLTMVISGVWEHLASPIITSFIQNILPVFIELLAQLYKTWDTVFTTIAKIIKEVWEGTILPVFDLITEIITNVFEDIKEAWDKWGDPIFSQLRTAIELVGDTVSNIYNTILKPIIDKTIELAKQLWEQYLRPLFKNVLDFIGTLMDTLLKLWNNVLYPLVNAIIEKFGPIIVTAVNNIQTIVQKVIAVIIARINAVITNLKNFLKFLGDVFSGDFKSAWEDLKKFFSGIWEGMENIVKSSINVIIGFVNGMLNGIAAGINLVVDTINSIQIDVPDWIPEIGGETIGFNLKRVEALQIPYLASGAVLPPNNPFMAVVGDQTHGTNIEAPLDTIKQALAEVLSDSAFISYLSQIANNTKETANKDFNVSIDDRTIARANVRGQRAMGRTIISTT